MDVWLTWQQKQKPTIDDETDVFVAGLQEALAHSSSINAFIYLISYLVFGSTEPEWGKILNTANKCLIKAIIMDFCKVDPQEMCTALHVKQIGL